MKEECEAARQIPCISLRHVQLVQVLSSRDRLEVCVFVLDKVCRDDNTIVHSKNRGGENKKEMSNHNRGEGKKGGTGSEVGPHHCPAPSSPPKRQEAAGGTVRRSCTQRFWGEPACTKLMGNRSVWLLPSLEQELEGEGGAPRDGRQHRVTHSPGTTARTGKTQKQRCSVTEDMGE